MNNVPVWLNDVAISSLNAALVHFYGFLFCWGWCHWYKKPKGRSYKVQPGCHRMNLWNNYWNYHLLLKQVKVSYEKKDIKTNLGGNWKRNHGDVAPAAVSFIFRAPCGLLDSVWLWINLYIPQSPQESLMIWWWQRDGPPVSCQKLTEQMSNIGRVTPQVQLRPSQIHTST